MYLHIGIDIRFLFTFDWATTNNFPRSTASWSRLIDRWFSSAVENLYGNPLKGRNWVSLVAILPSRNPYFSSLNGFSWEPTFPRSRKTNFAPQFFANIPSSPQARGISNIPRCWNLSVINFPSAWQTWSAVKRKYSLLKELSLDTKPRLSYIIRYSSLLRYHE